jgi:hypothetical protein
MPDDADAKTREQLRFLFGGVIYHVPVDNCSACDRWLPARIASTRTDRIGPRQLRRGLSI